MEGSSNQELADPELMARIADGDAAAFRVLSRRHAPRALAIARRILGSSAADDIVQEALLRIWVNAPRWRPSAQLRTWLYRIVVNLCLDEKRRPGTAPLEAAGEIADPRPDAAQDLEDRERQQRVAMAIEALPSRQRAAIVLTYQEGLSNAEAAAVLDTSVGGVETLLVRAKRALRAALGSSHAI
jgi:RNA polymerase sigma-70 factor (ECF subfamily)